MYADGVKLAWLVFTTPGILIKTSKHPASGYLLLDGNQIIRYKIDQKTNAPHFCFHLHYQPPHLNVCV